MQRILMVHCGILCILTMVRGDSIKHGCNISLQGPKKFCIEYKVDNTIPGSLFDNIIKNPDFLVFSGSTEVAQKCYLKSEEPPKNFQSALPCLITK